MLKSLSHRTGISSQSGGLIDKDGGAGHDLRITKKKKKVIYQI